MENKNCYQKDYGIITSSLNIEGWGGLTISHEGYGG